MIRWGVLSTANIARNQVIPAILESKNAILHSIASRDLEKAKICCQQFGSSRPFGSYEELLACPDVDAIYIPVPTSQHVEWSLKCLEAGKHVLCEKPIALKAAEIGTLIKAEAKSACILSEAFMVYYHPQWHTVKNLIADGKIGTLKHVQGSFTYYNKDPENMRNNPELGGGVLPDIGVYPIVTTRFVTGEEPQSIRARVEIDKTFGVDTYASVELGFKHFDLSFYVSTQMSLRQKMVFHGDNGRIEVHAPFNARNYGDSKVSIHSLDNNETQYVRFGEVNQYRLQIEAFSRAIEENNKDQLFSLEDSFKNQLVIDEIFKASNGM